MEIQLLFEKQNKLYFFHSPIEFITIYLIFKNKNIIILH
jgi:hypothetical protein